MTTTVTGRRTAPAAARASVARRSAAGAGRLLPGVIGVLVVLVLWQVVVTVGLVDRSTLPGPVDVVRDAVLQVPLADVLADVRISLGRVLVGCLIGGFLGTVVGIVTGWSRVVGRWATTPLEFLRPIPPLAWISLAIVWFGLGEGARVFIIAIAAFFPLYTSAHRATASIDPSLIHAGRTFGLRGWRLLTRIAVPATLPDIATGIRIAWGLAFGALVAAEILAADEGLGAMIADARQLNDIAQIVYGIFLIGALTLLTDLMLRLALRRFLRWSRP